MTHQKIYRRQLEGIIGEDKDIPRLRLYFQKVMEDSMKDEGMVPMLDIEPAFSLEYHDGRYKFVMTLHGVKVKGDAYKWHGMSNGRLLPSPTKVV